MGLVFIALTGMDERPLDVKLVYLKADVKKELRIKLPDGYRELRNQVGRLQRAMYGLVHARLLRSKNNRDGCRGVREVTIIPLCSPEGAPGSGGRHDHVLRR